MGRIHASLTTSNIAGLQKTLHVFMQLVNCTHLSKVETFENFVVQWKILSIPQDLCFKEKGNMIFWVKVDNGEDII